MKPAAVLVLLASFAQLHAASDVAQGKKLFEKKCSVCHASESAEKRIGPSLRGVKGGRLPDSIGRPASHDNILKKINDGGGGMPVFRELLTPEEKENIVAYVMTL
jgi:cytochrome c